MNTDAELAVKKSDTEQALVSKIQREMPSHLQLKAETILSQIKGSRATPFEKLDVLYQCVDELYAFVGKYVPCAVGCCHCCHYEITISELEIDYLEQKLAVKRRNLPVTSNSVTTHGLPCSFLVGSVCSIYSQRPFMCRQCVTLDTTSRWCQVDVCNKFNQIMFSFKNVKRAYAFLADPGGRGKFADIRHVFPFGLSESQRITEGN